MIKNVLTHIGGIEAYGILSVCLFFVVFTGMLVWALRLNRQELDACGRIPLADDSARNPDSQPLPESLHESE